MDDKVAKPSHLPQTELEVRTVVQEKPPHYSCVERRRFHPVFARLSADQTVCIRLAPASMRQKEKNSDGANVNTLLQILLPYWPSEACGALQCLPAARPACGLSWNMLR